MLDYTIWFICTSLFLGLMEINFAIVDAELFRKKQDYDGEGVDIYPFVKKYIHLFWLVGLGVFLVGAMEVGIRSPLKHWQTLVITPAMFLTLGFIWDMTYSWLKTRTLTKSLKYWFHIPGVITIGWDSRSEVIGSYWKRGGAWIVIYLIGLTTIAIGG